MILDQIDIPYIQEHATCDELNAWCDSIRPSFDNRDWTDDFNAAGELFKDLQGMPYCKLDQWSLTYDDEWKCGIHDGSIQRIGYGDSPEEAIVRAYLVAKKAQHE